MSEYGFRGKNFRSPDWTVEQDETLRDALADGHSHRVAALMLNEKHGTQRSRNACIGRAIRKGFAQRPRHKVEGKVNAYDGPARARKKIAELVGDAPKLPKVKRSTRNMNCGPRKPGKLTVGGFTMSVVPPDLTMIDPAPLRCVEITPLNLSLMDLKIDSCRWPYGGHPGNDPITFCGHPAFMRSYCMAHYQLSIGSGTPSERAAHRVSERDAA